MLEPSQVEFSDKDLKKPFAKLIFATYRLLGLIRVNEKKNNESKQQYESSNFTLINFYLIKMGPTREDRLTFNLLILQVNFTFKIKESHLFF